MKINLYLCKWRLLFTLALLSAFTNTFSQQVAKGLTGANGQYIGFYEFKPYDYNSTTKKYPLIIFLHGVGERGNGTTELPRVLVNAVPRYCANGATMTFTVAGKTESFMVLSPQLSAAYGDWMDFYTDEMMNYAKQNLRVDTNRIYLCGLSLGGGGVWKYVIASSPAAKQFAAIAPCCGACQFGNYCNITQNRVGVWAFHAIDDGTVGVGCTYSAINSINACNPVVPPRMTIYPNGGHAVWDRAFDTSHYYQNPNVYEWLLTNDRSQPPPPNVLPIANAGPDQNIILPTTTTTVSGLGSVDPDGGIASYFWSQIGGPTYAPLTTNNIATIGISGLTNVGTYSFKLTVTDIAGAVAYDTVNINVLTGAPPPNQKPVANAGADISITLPTNSTTLNGSSSYDPDGSIGSYQWTKISGPATFGITNAFTSITGLTNLVQGVYSFRLQVTDNLGATAADTVVVTVNAGTPPPNQPPVANAGADISITLPANSTTLNGTASADPDGTITTYAWTKISGPATYTISNTSAASTGLTNLVQGVYSFGLQVTDNNGATAADTVIVTVNAALPPPNQPPVANAGSDISIVLPINNSTLNGSASTDPDGSITTYSWTKISGPASYTISNAGAVTTGVANLVQGVYGFRLLVTDNNGATAADTVLVTVNPAPPPPNQPPVANAGADVTMTLPTNSTTLNGSGSSDPDGTIAAYLWTKISGPASYSITNPNTTTTGLINLAQGVYNFRLQVTDNAGASSADTVVITVNAPAPPPNQPPVANAGYDVSLTLPSNSTFLIGTASYDLGGTISSYAWSYISGPAQYNLSSPNTANSNLTNLVQGVYSFRLQVTDNLGATGADTVVITVNAIPPPPNQPPVANAGGDISITLPVNNTTLNGSASNDPDGSISSYSWTKISGPASYTINDTSVAVTGLTNLVQGVYSFRLLVTDNNGTSAADTVVVTVNAAIPPPPPNQPPIANAGADISITLPVNNTTLNGSASIDPDGSINGYAWTYISGPSQYSIASSGSASTSLSNLVQGVYSFRLQVTDNSGATAADTVVVTVNAAIPPPNQPPVANAGPDIFITLPSNSTTLNGTASTDPDGTITTYAWTKISGPVAFTINNAGAASTGLTNLVQGVYGFRLLVTDNNGASAADTVLVTVNAAPPPPNQPPVAIAGADVSITLPTSNTVLNGSASFDPDGSISAYSWTYLSGPSQYAIASPASVNTAISNLVQGVYSFRLQVTDNNGASASDTVIVTVNAAIPPPNQPPVAYAGADISITLPNNSTVLNGSGSFDSDGTITGYAWSYVSGPSQYSIASPGAVNSSLNNLVQGVYSFRLQVTDNNGASAADTVIVTVNPAPPPPPPSNQPPIANAGADITLTLPSNTTLLDGSASIDPDGTISTYNWTYVSGPSQYSIVNPTTAITTLNNLVQGVYTFQLQVTDNSGASSSDQVIVTVNPQPNQPPVANAGQAQVIYLPATSVNLDGSNSYDPDGNIVSYSWNKISGTGAITIVNSNTSKPTVVGLATGLYIFELTVTDNDGAIGKDRVTITVDPAQNQLPIADAGRDTSIALPADKSVLVGIKSTDPDGNIVAYSWKQLSGPGTAVIVSPFDAVTEVNGLAEGDYVFELTVTDNAGATAKSTVRISIVNTFRNSEYFRIYPNPVNTTSLNLQYIDDKIGKLRIRIYDVSGKLTLDMELNKDRSLLSKQINVGALRSGMYYLEILHADGNKLTRPFVKQ